MTAAIFGLLGVVVGGVLNGVIARWQVSRAESDELRAAARLLLTELFQVHTYVCNVAGGMDATRPPTHRWTEFEALFARTLSYKKWNTIHNGATALHMLDTHRDDARALAICTNRVGDAIEAINGPALYDRRPTLRLRLGWKLRRVRARWRLRRMEAKRTRAAVANS
jgi:hypothetical protein